MHRWISAPVLVATLAGGALLTGCGSESTSGQAGDDTGSSAPVSSASAPASASPAPPSAGATSPAAPVLPDCASVWVDGQTLPFSYRGCLDGARTVSAQRQSCEMGKPLLSFRTSFWAVAGGPVHRVSGTLAKDAGWHRALVQCGG